MGSVAVEPKALFSQDGKAWHDGSSIDWSDLASDPSVVKLVIGDDPHPKVDDDAQGKELIDLALPDLAALFPNLTHLHLWHCNVKRLDSLPEGLRCLDLRGCRELESIGTSLQAPHEILIDGCSMLKTVPVQSFDAIEALSVAACRALSPDWFSKAITGTKLRELNATRCHWLKRITDWSLALVDVRLSGCTQLEALPKNWPNSLRRIELRNCERLRKIPNFHKSLDYIDLAFTRSLQDLPHGDHKPRTLYLYGSGIRTLPASEHGDSPDRNVAANSANFFHEGKEFGTGDVRRFKILILGNGSAGKTALTLNLIGEDPQKAKQFGSTHGVHFRSWEVDAVIADQGCKVPSTLWDFGGQEIYHNTHSLFMGTGSLFLLVWNPEQDGKQPKENDVGYQDQWQPLRYWFEIIQQSSIQKPSIALICSHRDAPTKELEQSWRDHVPAELAGEVECFYVQSDVKRPACVARDSVRTWIEGRAGRLIEASGTDVPSYWQIAQDMVEEWLSAKEPNATGLSPDENGRQAQRSFDDFKNCLLDRIQSVIASTPERFPHLAENWPKRKVEEDTARVEHVLSFLTNIGLVFWRRELFERRVIVGQQWALDGLYTLLDRRDEGETKDRPIYRSLREMNGLFTLSELDGLNWGRSEQAWHQEPYTDEDKRLLLSFMESCGLCFKVRSEKDAWREEDIYASIEHLPSANAINAVEDFDRLATRTRAIPQSIQIEDLWLHKLHWQRILAATGRQYGKCATYMSDAIRLQFDDGTTALIRCRHSVCSAEGIKPGLVIIRVIGPKSEETAKSLEDYVRYFLPKDSHQPPQETPRVGEAIEVQEVFISYAWQPKESNDDEIEIPAGYEIPVDSIEKMLESHTRWKLIRDKRVNKLGDDLKEFMKRASTSPKVIMVHSDQWFESPYCMFELYLVLDECLKPNKSPDSVIIPVEHIRSGINEQNENMTPCFPGILKFWENYNGNVPAATFDNLQHVRSEAPSALRKFQRKCTQVGRIKWKDDNAETVLESILDRLENPSGQP